MKRRQLLAATAGFGAAGSAGCSSITSRGDGGMGLGGVTLLNSDTSAHDFEVRIDKDGERIHESEYMVEGEGFASLGCDWIDSMGTYVLAARTETGGWYERDVTEETPDGECRSVMIEYDGGTFDISTGMNCEFGCQ